MTVRRPGALRFFQYSEPAPCAYLPDRLERLLVAELTGPDADALHDRLAQAGFRRSQHVAYRPACAGCEACVPLRIVAGDFRRSRSQERIWNRNRDLRDRVTSARATAEQFRLFAAYQHARHPGSRMAAMDMAAYRAMVEDSCVDTGIMELRGRDRRLYGACLVDRLASGLSAVYLFYDPAAGNRSLGTLQILRLVDLARRSGLEHVYLGYWIADCGNMAYKARFRPAEILTPDGWRHL